MPESVYLIDTFSLMFQVFHGVPPMTGPSGQPTNAIFGISRDLVGLLTNHRPAWLIAAWDSSEPSFRNTIYADYKANRKETPPDLISQIPRVRELIEAFGIPVIEHAGWEADDVIATLAGQAAGRGDTVRIITSDKDARQLLGPQVQLFNLRKNTSLGEAELLLDWGIRPDQVVDFQALVGDAVDNIPGVPLIGPKKAAQLLNQFGTLDEVLAHADEAPGAKLKENLKLYAEQARLSRELARLKTDLPMEFDWTATRNPKPDVLRLQDLFREFGFRKLIDDVRPFAATNLVATKKSIVAARTKSLFGDDDTVTVTESVEVVVVITEPAAPKHTWQVIDTPELLADFVALLQPQTRLCLDLETTSVDPRRAEIVGWAFSWQPGQGYYLPVQGPPGSRLLDAASVVAALKPILENPAVEVVNQNIKYDLIVLRCAGINIASLGVDPMVGDYLLDAGARSHGLEALMDKYLHRQGMSISDLIGTGKKQKSMAEVPIKQIAEYATEDADCALQIADVIAPQLKDARLWELYWNLERPLIPVLAELEYNGIRVDADELRRQSADLTEQLQRLMGEIHEIAGETFNIDSPVQLRKILFDKLGLPVKRKTKTGPSTDQEVLEELAALHPLPAKITEHRHLSKLKGTYLDALPLLIHPQTGRIHCSFNQVVAATGRLSSSDPNLQNIPIRTPEGRRIRKAFVPGHPGWKLVCADYSQIELRMLAHFCGDPVLLEAFASGIDIHTAVAAQVYGVELAAVDADMRRVAKAVNFGVIYGQSPFGLAAALGIPQEDAAKFIDEYFTKYAGVDRYLEEILAECERTGYARTILGRRRKIDGIRPDRNRSRNMPERTAINTVIQGSAADLIKQAMIKLHDRLCREAHPAKMLLQIHDELVFEAPADAVPSLVQIVREEMEHALPLDVPLVVDVSAGDNWLETDAVS
ncbi:MAG: DNA polymerase I [Planctomycetaceae bacterium]|nr:DNA polymerase I [Planctomycetaceae bacterium]